MSETITTTSDTRVLSVTLLPFIRSREVYFFARGLLPNTTHSAFFDGVDVTSWCREESFQRISSSTVQNSTSQNNTATSHPDGSTALISNANGEIEGSFFIPNTPSLRFRAGRREFKLRESAATTDANALSLGLASYTAQGTLEVRETTVTRTVIRPAPPPPPPFRWIDPVAQSFIINDENGAFITSIDIPFRTASTTTPIRCQIRTMELGLPTTNVIAETWLNASDFTGKTSTGPSFSNSNTFVTFTFEEPVFIEGNVEHAIVLISNSNDYEVWTAIAGDFLVNSTTRRVMEQPSLGSFFKSQNGSTWTPDQGRDLMFRLKRAAFTTSAATAYFENVDLPVRKLETNAISTTDTSGTITVEHPNHGLVVGDKVTIAGATAVNGITAVQINTQHDVTNAEDMDVFQVATAGTANATGRGGGSNIVVQENYMYSIMHPIFNTLRLPNTNLNFAAKTTTGQSVAGSETAWQKDSSYNAVTVNVDTKFDNLKIVGSAENETASISGQRSLAFRASMQTTNARVSPVIDLQRLSAILLNRRIDRQAASAATGFNVPPTFVAETDNSDGTSKAKHLTTQIALEEPAVGLRVLFGANRPSDTFITLYYKTLTSGSDTPLSDIEWTEASIDEVIRTDEQDDIFREYTYTIESDPFTRFQLKFVFTSSDQAKWPTIRDLRAIALAT